MSIQAYQRNATQAENPRDLEYRAFAHVTRKLMLAKEQGRSDIVGLVTAISENRRLWSVLAADCAEPGNALPHGLRAQIISLALWVGRHGRAALQDLAALDDLIDVNRQMMDGLAAH